MPLLLRAAGPWRRRTRPCRGCILDVVESVGGRTAYLALLAEHPTALPRLVKLADASPWIAALLAQHPVLLDELLDPRTL